MLHSRCGAECVQAVGSSLFSRSYSTISNFCCAAVTPKNGVEFCQKFIIAIRYSLVTLCIMRCCLTFWDTQNIRTYKTHRKCHMLVMLSTIKISSGRAISPLSSIVLWFTLSVQVRAKHGHREAIVSLKMAHCDTYRCCM